MSDERAALRALLEAIQRTSALQPDAHELQDVQPLIEKLAVSFHFAQRDYFRQRFRTTCETLSMVQERRYLYLRAPAREANVLPIMAIDAKVTNRSAAVKVQVALFDRNNIAKALGYRFEYGSGSHQMLHCQHIIAFTGAADISVELPGTPTWVPTNQPSFPLDGKSAGVHCLLAAYISVYGLKEVSDTLEPECPSIKTHMQDLHLSPFS